MNNNEIVRPQITVKGVITYLLMFLVNHIIGVKKHKFYFEGMGGGYNDNARAVSEKLHELHPDSIIVWGIDKEKYDKAIIPSYVTPAINGVSRLYNRATSSGWVSCLITSNCLYKSHKQVYVQCWHGDRAIKKILKDVCGMYLYESQNCDLFTSGSNFFTILSARAFDYHGKVLQTGCPRNDKLVNIEESNIIQIKKDLKIEDGVKVLLYAPTFRDSSVEKQSINLNIPNLLSELEKRTGDKWIGLVRFHPLVRLNTSCLNEDVIDVSNYFDMADLLLISNILITDYSSSATDYTLLKRPLFLYQPDLTSYTSKDRELYLNMKETPFWAAKSQEELEKLVREKCEADAIENCVAINEFYGTQETGHSSEDVVGFLYNR